MNPNEILSFLLPQFSDRLQLAFFAIILFMICFTVVSAHRTARPASWEHKWNRGTPDDPSDDLDIEHGSVTDLWHAVATAPEKLAEIMPGMLLVVGLLGTFLGLGLALNHASSILGQADLTSAGAAADSMQNLLGLLQGLGTKFKTSTWGIMGFVLLKIWSEVTRFEEKRLAWVIGKVKAELESRKRSALAAESAKQEALFANIGRAATGIVDGIARQFDTLARNNESLNLQIVRHLADVVQATHGVRTEVAKMHGDTDATRTAMMQFTESTQQVVQGMGEAANRMAGGADKVGAGAEGLVGAIESFESQFTVVLDNVRKDLGAAITNMSNQASATLETGSAKLGEATQGIATALGQLSKDVTGTMSNVQSSIKEALDIQKKASAVFITSTDALSEKVIASTEVVETMKESISEGLTSVASSARSMKSVAEASKKSSENLEATIVELRSSTAEVKRLPDVLEPLPALVREQRALVAALAPLTDIVGVQRAVVELLQTIQAEKPAAAVADAPAHAAELT